MMMESYWKGVLGALLVFTARAFADVGETESGGGQVRLRVLSYNIHHGEGVDGKLDLPRIADVIRSVNPDLVALQEVDRGTERTNKVDQPAELARLTGMNVVFGGNIRYQGGHYGNAVLSRFTIKRHKNHLLPLFDNGEQRGALEVEVELPNEGRRVLFLATHLDHRAGDRERHASAKAINKLVASSASQPAVLAGDLNDLPESETLREFGALWTRANEQVLPTVPVNQPTKQIDFILFRPGERWKTIDVRVLDEAVASDHRAIFTVLTLFPNETAITK
ncbi:MAG: endonuclease/exonuclease/phosphatase family protein [Planctomycetota bacterium]|jgi:endonuclease/exonuclease/phosphatase family metal-dependent hydrolase